MKICIATGGSGGHIFPALEVAGQLQRQGHSVLLAGSFRNFQQHVQEAGFRCHFSKMIGLSWKNFFRFIVLTFVALKESLGLFKEEQPDVILGFGGFSSVPYVLAGLLQRRPIMLHEQNVLPGRANRFFGRFVNRVAVSFEDTRKHFSASKVVWTGCPIRAKLKIEENEKMRLYDVYGLSPKKFLILVVGGSQGSHKLNRIFVETLSALKQKLDFQVIHLCGENDFNGLLDEYQKSQILYYLSKFHEKMEEVYSLADCVVSRAGAVAVTEIAQYALRAVLVPYPFAGKHQINNAQQLARCIPAQILDEEALNPQVLSSAILNLKDQSIDKGEVAAAVELIFKANAVDSIVDQLQQLRK